MVVEFLRNLIFWPIEFMPFDGALCVELKNALDDGA